MTQEDFAQGANVLDEVVETIGVLQNLLMVADKAGVFKFDMNFEGEHLKGDVIATAQGQTIRAQMDATRVK